MFAMGSIADTGDEIIIPEPFYANYNGFAIASGVKIVPVISKIEDNFALPNISEFEKLNFLCNAFLYLLYISILNRFFIHE